MHTIAQAYGYQRIDTPTFEDAGLFARSIGEGTDIVEKETYTFEDRSGDKVTLRPEGTASVCRAYVEHGMHSLTQPVRLYYEAAIFRYERPQAGRYREHHQFGVEALGEQDAAVDAEVIDMAWQLCAGLGLRSLVLLVNSIGCRKCRPAYLASLREYYTKHEDTLCPDCSRRLDRNTLRLLDCKKESCVPLAEQAPRSADHLCDECSIHFQKLLGYLGSLSLPFEVNHRLVRGLDYYTKTVFEVTPEGAVVAQATIGGGGRYDDLVEELGGRATPGMGFATGIERIVLNLKKQKVKIPEAEPAEVYVAYQGELGKGEAVRLAALLRRSGCTVVSASGDRRLKAQLRQADAAGARRAIIIGDSEIESGTVILRDMGTGEQQMVKLEEVVELLTPR
jgi:histidyl-tRNA synthetase